MQAAQGMAHFVAWLGACSRGPAENSCTVRTISAHSQLLAPPLCTSMHGSSRGRCRAPVLWSHGLVITIRADDTLWMVCMYLPNCCCSMLALRCFPAIIIFNLLKVAGTSIAFSCLNLRTIKWHPDTVSNWQTAFLMIFLWTRWLLRRIWRGWAGNSK